MVEYSNKVEEMTVSGEPQTNIYKMRYLWSQYNKRKWQRSCHCKHERLRGLNTERIPKGLYAPKPEPLTTTVSPNVSNCVLKLRTPACVAGDRVLADGTWLLLAWLALRLVLEPPGPDL